MSKFQAKAIENRGWAPTKAGVSAGNCVVVNGYSATWLARGFPWVYRDELVGTPPALSVGARVRIQGQDGGVLGVGIWDQGHVAVRRFREDDGPLDAALLRDRLLAALSRRPLPPETTAFRWLHAENDDTPGVRLDVWGDELTLTLDAPGLLPLAGPLLEEARALWPRIGGDRPLRAIWQTWRPAQGEEQAVERAPRGLVWGEDRGEDVPVLELGLRYRVRPADGFDAGVYADMRAVRAWMAPHWRGRRVLNTFAFTGAFTVSAAAGGAREVLSVDLSPQVLERLAENLRENGLDPEQHPRWDMDVFRALDRLRRKEERFDVVIADPPSFARGPDGPWSASRDFPRLIAACLRVLSPGGWLVAATNNGTVSPKAFQEQIGEGALRAGRRLRLLHQGSPPVDFPAALAFPESRYLKCWVLQA